jgi:hypothetical protein
VVLLDPNSESSALLPVSSLFTKYPNVKTPRLIHHDYEERLLIMTDLGSSVVTIDDDWLTHWQEPGPAPLPEDVECIAKDLMFASSANSSSPKCRVFVSPSTSVQLRVSP